MYSFNDHCNNDLPEDVDAEYVTAQSMGALWDLVIQPMESKLTDDDKTLIDVIGMTLKIVARKAKCYEDLKQGKFSNESDGFSRN